MYTGYLLSVGAEWFKFLASHVARLMVPYFEGIDFPPQLLGGDPIFIRKAGTEGCAVYFHTHISYRPLAKIENPWQEFAGMNGLPKKSTATSSAPDVFVFHSLHTISPPLQLNLIGAHLESGVAIQELTGQQVLDVLRALPLNAQTAWTKRVVARGNDL